MNIENWEQGRAVWLLGLHNSNLLCSVYLCTSIYSLTRSTIVQENHDDTKILNSGVSATESLGAFEYGKHVGIAFQLVDDLLDFVASADQLGRSC